DRRVAEPLARHREQQADVAPAELDHPEHRGEVGAVAVLSRARAVGLAAHAGGAGAADVRALVHAVDQRRQHVELLRVGVLGLVVLARDRPEDLGRDLVCLARQRPELLRYLEVDHASSPPSITPAARRSLYQRSTGCSLTKPWPPSSWT